MPIPEERLLTGWGRSSRSPGLVITPGSQEELLEALGRLSDRPLLARGAGRSYGDNALNAQGYVIDMSRLRTIHSFDDRTGEVIVDPGVSIGELLHKFAPRGWIAPVSPGTQFVTMGGAVANDVHGKNHDRDGSFGDHLQGFDLILPNGALKRVDAVAEPELFAGTLGGIGLTGLIARVTLRLKPVPSTMLLVRERRIAGLEAFLEAFAEARTRYGYSVGWIDGVARGRHLGRGILETADHTDGALALPKRRRIRMPFNLPSRTINSATVACFNKLYYQRVPRRGRERRVDLEKFLYPLDSILEWNRIYGRNGFVQFQCVIPDEASHRGMRTLLERVSLSGRASFLAVIKTLGRAGSGYLSFPRPGVTLALDFPLTIHTRPLLDSLHDITLEHGGRVYLAKDACLTPLQFHRMYPAARDFAKLLARIDPSRRMRSDMSRRLEI